MNPGTQNSLQSKAILISSESSSDRPPVLTKLDFVRRYSEGEFGNAAPTWNTLQEYQDSGYGGLVHIRNRIASGPTWYNCTPEQVVHAWKAITFPGGIDPESLYISAMAPHDQGTIQGEVQQTEKGLSLLWTTAKKPMREALAFFSKQEHGIIATVMLKHWMCPNSYEWLQFLLKAYPLHVIEFSCFRVNWGTVPGCNTVWWEVRLY